MRLMPRAEEVAEHVAAEGHEVFDPGAILAHVFLRSFTFAIPQK
jgi:hypothetical protein